MPFWESRVLAGALALLALSADPAGAEVAQSLECAALANRVADNPAEIESIVTDLESGRTSCPEPRGECEAALIECAGYLRLEVAGRAGDPGERDLLVEALETLKRAYFGHRRRAETATNLSVTYRRLAVIEAEWGDAAARLELTRRAADVLLDYAYSSPRAGDYFISAGDLYRALGREESDDWTKAKPLFEDARQAYAEAARLLAADETAERRLVSGLWPWPKRLFSQSVRLKDRGMLRPAQTGFEEFIAWRSTRPTNWILRRFGAGFNFFDQADDAVVHWVDTLARLGNVSVRDLDRLPPPEESDLPKRYYRRPMSEIRALIGDPVGPPIQVADAFTRMSRKGDPQLRWWLKDDARRDAVARLLGSLSRTLQARGEIAEAGQALERSFFRIAPEEDDLDEPGAFTVLELGAELGGFYAAYGDEIDPEGIGFVRLLERLEGARSQVDGDLEDRPLLEEYEALIGSLLIGRIEPGLTERPWEVEVDGAVLAGLESGLAHIERSLEIDRELSTELPGRALPQPGLEMLAARIHALSRRSEMARRRLLEAACGYLDLDSPDAASEALVRAKVLSGLSEDEEASTARALGEIAIRRRAAWVSPLPTAPGLSLDFLERQRFKLLADAGNVMAERGVLQHAMSLHIKAIRKLAGLDLLPSPDDLARVERALATVLDKRPMITLGIGMVFDPPSRLGAWFPKEFVLPETAGRTARELAIGADVFLAAELRELLEGLSVDPELVVSFSQSEDPSHGGQRTKPDLVVSILARSELESQALDLKAAIESANLEAAGVGISEVSLLIGNGLRRRSSVDPEPPDDWHLLRAAAERMGRLEASLHLSPRP